MRVPSERSAFPLTYDDYALLPQDRNRYEILHGELYMTSSPSYGHQLAVYRLATSLGSYVEARGLGRVLFARLDVLLAETNIVQPDILFLSRGKIPPGKAEEHPGGARSRERGACGVHGRVGSGPQEAQLCEARNPALLDR